MNIPLKQRYLDWIAEQVSAGRYASEIEAVEDALAAKIADEEVERLRARLKESIAQAERSETVPAEEVFRRLHDRIDRIAAERGK